MALVPGLVAVLRIVPLGDKVALGETMWRVLSASSTPAWSSVEEMLEESLRGVELADNALRTVSPRATLLLGGTMRRTAAKPGTNAMVRRLCSPSG